MWLILNLHQKTEMAQNKPGFGYFARKRKDTFYVSIDISLLVAIYLVLTLNTTYYVKKQRKRKTRVKSSITSELKLTSGCLARTGTGWQVRLLHWIQNLGVHQKNSVIEVKNI